jgi:cytochrome P450
LLVIYRLTFHPLARFPGPLLSKITSFSIFLQANTGDRHLIHLAEHRKYGPIVRIAPNQLSFADPSALRSIYQSARASNPLRKAEWYETVDAPSGAYSTHTEISRTKHAFRRRVMEQAFSDSALRTFEPLVTENVETLLRVIEEQPEQNMSTLATHFTYDVMGDLVFGKRFNCMTSPEHRFMPKLIMASSASIYAVSPPLSTAHPPTNTARLHISPFNSSSAPSSAHKPS